ncbi:hypothetical protein KY290_008029 [Solanum tuberosum]|uniref:Uncharacterized protein n=1 Tax=Solanum tuberosum TaxID=4113 RepID=A0ABQ7W795_SOLTU|nr:hypothetical protein KY290_008029 [Solanum tuberosum]
MEENLFGEKMKKTLIDQCGQKILPGSYTQMEFPRFEGGDPRGWILKAKNFDALDLFSWINREQTLLYSEELVKALQENYGPAEFQNPDEHLCSIQKKRFYTRV